MKVERTSLIAFALALASALAMSIALSNLTSRFAGQINQPGFEIQAFLVCMPLSLILGALVVRAILLGHIERYPAFVKFMLMTIILAPLLLIPYRQHWFDAMVDGFAMWARSNSQLGDSRPRVVADVSARKPAPFTPDWPRDGDMIGISLENSKWPSPFYEASVAEVWIIKEGVLLVWRDPMWRFIYYPPTDGALPSELESPVTVWQDIGNGAMAGVSYPH